MAPQPLGPSCPMVWGHLMTIGIQDVGLILSQALKINMYEVMFYYDSRANNTSLGVRIGSTAFGKNPTCQLSLSATLMNTHSHSSFIYVVSMDSLQVGSRIETPTLSVRSEAMAVYPTARSPSIGVLIDLDDANLMCIVTIANSDDLATTRTLAPRTVATCVTRH